MTVKVLVADDSATIQKVIKIAFSRYEVVVTEASSYVESLRKAESTKPEVLIVDASLVGSRSAEDFEKLQSLAGGCPVLMLAGSYESIDETKFQAVGLSHFLKKPFDTADIIKKIQDDLNIKLQAKDVGTSWPAAATSGGVEPSQTAVPAPSPVANTAASTVPTVPPPLPNIEAGLPKEIPTQVDVARATPNIEVSGIPELSELSADFPPELSSNQPSDFSSELGDISQEYSEESISDLSVSSAAAADPFEKMREMESELNKQSIVEPEAKGTPAFERTDVQNKIPSPVEVSAPVSFPEEEAILSATPAFEPMNRQELRDMVTPIMREELRSTVRDTVIKYCQENFNELAREIILQELRRLADEKSQHLANS